LAVEARCFELTGAGLALDAESDSAATGHILIRRSWRKSAMSAMCVELHDPLSQKSASGGKRTSTHLAGAGDNHHMLKLYRWLCYLDFAMGAVLFWALFFFEILGVVPFAEPLCALEPAGCPPPSALKHLLIAIFLLSILAMTTLLFVFFRRWLRGRMGMEDDL
jgi:hypothetical protein